MASGATAEYGKLLRFVHHPSSFTEESRPLLRFLLREFEDLQAQQEILKVYGNTRLGKELPLSPGGFDRFFELYAGSCVDFRENGRVRSIRLMDENPPLTIQVHAPEEGGGLLLRTEDAGSIQGAAHFYVLHGTRLYRCAEDYASHMTEWISTIQTAQNGLFFAGDDLPAFCASVLPVIRPYIRLEGDTDGAGALPAPCAGMRRLSGRAGRGNHHRPAGMPVRRRCVQSVRGRADGPLS